MSNVDSPSSESGNERVRLSVIDRGFNHRLRGVLEDAADQTQLYTRFVPPTPSTLSSPNFPTVVFKSPEQIPSSPKGEMCTDHDVHVISPSGVTIFSAIQIGPPPSSGLLEGNGVLSKEQYDTGLSSTATASRSGLDCDVSSPPASAFSPSHDTSRSSTRASNTAKIFDHSPKSIATLVSPVRHSSTLFSRTSSTTLTSPSTPNESPLSPYVNHSNLSTETPASPGDPRFNTSPFLLSATLEPSDPHVHKENLSNVERGIITSDLHADKPLQEELRACQRKLSDLTGKHGTLQNQFLMAVEERKHVEYELKRLRDQYSQLQTANRVLLSRLDDQANSHAAQEESIKASIQTAISGSVQEAVAEAVEAERKKSSETLRRMKVSSDKRFRDWNAKIEAWKNEVQKAMDEKLASSRAYVLASREKLIKERNAKEEALAVVDNLENEIKSIKELHEQEKKVFEDRLTQDAEKRIADSNAQVLQRLRDAVEKEVRDQFVVSAKDEILKNLENALRSQLEAGIRASLEREYAQKMTDLYSEFDSKLQEALGDPSRKELCYNCRASISIQTVNAEVTSTVAQSMASSSSQANADAPQFAKDMTSVSTPDVGKSHSSESASLSSTHRTKTTPYAYPFPPNFSLLSSNSARNSTHSPRVAHSSATSPPNRAMRPESSTASTLESPELDDMTIRSNKSDALSPLVPRGLALNESQSSTPKETPIPISDECNVSPQSPIPNQVFCDIQIDSKNRLVSSVSSSHNSDVRDESQDSDVSEDSIPIQSTMVFHPEASPLSPPQGDNSEYSIPVLTSMESLPSTRNLSPHAPKGGVSIVTDTPMSPRVNADLSSSGSSNVAQSDKKDASHTAPLRGEVGSVSDLHQTIGPEPSSPDSSPLDSGSDSNSDEEDELSLDDIHVSPHKFAYGKDWINRLTKEMGSSEPTNRSTVAPDTSSVINSSTPDSYASAEAVDAISRRGRSRVVVERNSIAKATENYGHQPRSSQSPLNTDDAASTTKKTDVPPHCVPSTPRSQGDAIHSYDNIPLTPTSLDGLDTKYIIAIENMSEAKIMSLLERAGVPFTRGTSLSALRYLLMLATKRGLESEPSSRSHHSTPRSDGPKSPPKGPTSPNTTHVDSNMSTNTTQNHSSMAGSHVSPERSPDVLHKEYKELPIFFEKNIKANSTSSLDSTSFDDSTTGFSKASVPESLPRRAPPVPPSYSISSSARTQYSSDSNLETSPRRTNNSVSISSATTIDLDTSSDLSVIDADADYNFESSMDSMSHSKQDSAPGFDTSDKSAFGSSHFAGAKEDVSAVASASGHAKATECRATGKVLDRVKYNEKEVKARQRQRLEELRLAELRAESEQNERNSIESSLNARVERWVASASALRPLLSTLNNTLESLLTHYGKENDRSLIHLKKSLLTEIDSISSKQDLRKTYFKVIRVLHPDKISSLGVSVGAMLVCQKVFSVLSDAYTQAQTRPDGGMGVIVKRASDSYTSSAFSSSNFFAQAHASFGNNRSKSQHNTTYSSFTHENEDIPKYFRPGMSKMHSKSWYASSANASSSNASESFFASKAQYNREPFPPSASTASTHFGMPRTQSFTQTSNRTSGATGVHASRPRPTSTKIPPMNSQQQPGGQYAPSSMASILAAAARARNAALYANSVNLGSNQSP